MSFYTTEEQVYELFSRAAEIKKIVMGLDKNSKTPCGFCFVMYGLNLAFNLQFLSFCVANFWLYSFFSNYGMPAAALIISL